MPTQPSMSGRVCLVTGATSGIGRATALELAELGAAVIVTGRDERLGRETVEEIRDRAKNPSVDLLIADLSSQKEVRGLASQVRERHPRLHVIINNAGVIMRKRKLTVDGIETQLAVNHLAPFLLTSLLLDLLKLSVPSRIINVASQVESMGAIDFDDLERERRYDRLESYCQSKLANVLFTYELARRLEGTGVVANCLHPGVVATRLLDDYIGRPRVLRFVTRLRNCGVKQGASTSVYLASSPAVEGVSGKYFVNSKEAISSPLSRNESLARRLWQVSERLTGLA